MGAGLRGGRRVLVAAAGGALASARLGARRVFFTFVSCTCEVWDTPFACSASGRMNWCGSNLDGGAEAQSRWSCAFLLLDRYLSSLNGNPRLPTMTDLIL